MTKRLQPCLTCKPETGTKFPRKRGFTRHKNRVCATCHRLGPPSESRGKTGRAA